MSTKGIVWRDAPAGGPWTLLGIPGRYAKDVPVPLESTGRSLSEMKRLIAQHPDVRLKIVDMEPQEAPESPTAAKAKKAAPVAAKEG